METKNLDEGLFLSQVYRLILSWPVKPQEETGPDGSPLPRQITSDPAALAPTKS